MNTNNILKNLTILYIEDEDSIRVNVVNFLKQICKNVYDTSNTIDGMELYKNYKPNIILTDICMPKKDGIEFIKDIRQKDFKTPIIITTAYRDEKYLMDAIKLHLEDYIVKPFVYSDLLSAIYKCTKRVMENGGFKIMFLNGSIFDINKNIIYKNDEEIILSKKELFLLKLLIEKRETIVSYNEIAKVVWKSEVMSKGALKTLVSLLRQKVGNESITVTSGIGYKLTF